MSEHLNALHVPELTKPEQDCMSGMPKLTACPLHGAPSLTWASSALDSRDTPTFHGPVPGLHPDFDCVNRVDGRLRAGARHAAGYDIVQGLLGFRFALLLLGGRVNSWFARGPRFLACLPDLRQENSAGILMWAARSKLQGSDPPCRACLHAEAFRAQQEPSRCKQQRQQQPMLQHSLMHQHCTQTFSAHHACRGHCSA